MLTRILRSACRGTLWPGLQTRVASGWRHWRHDAAERNALRKYQAWIQQLNSTEPDVLVGTNLAWGGVREHIHAIRKYSKLRVELAPPDWLLQRFTTNARNKFANCRLERLRAVHSHVFPWFISWCRQQQQAGVRWIHTYHLNYYAEHAKGGLLPWQEEVNDALLNLAPLADVRISVSRWQQLELSQKHGIATDFIPNGVDVAACDRADGDRFRRRMGRRPFVLYVGRNDPVKNPADFVRLASCLPDLRFIMMGHDLSRDVLKGEWELEVPENMEVCGSVSHLEVQDALAACSALVVTSRREGLPTLVLEAMAHGKPIVVPEEAGCVEAIDDGEFGFVYRPGNMESLAEQTLSAIGSEGVCARARARVIRDYDWRVIVPMLDRIYEDAVGVR